MADAHEPAGLFGEGTHKAVKLMECGNKVHSFGWVVESRPRHDEIQFLDFRIRECNNAISL